MVLFVLSISHCLSQQRLKGIVLDNVSNEPIVLVSILLKNSEGILIDFKSTNENGYYSFELNKSTDTLLIETSIMSYLTESKILIIDKTDFQKTYTIDFRLKERLTELDEVYVEGEKRAVTVKADTTSYNISLFKDGSERVVEDLLKKLPGITIGENGNLKFKGKQVTRVLLDGDNIFNENYAVGTKNINSDILEGIQAIEDYNTNPLLKGIRSSEDVAVNLILKKGKTDVSGNAEMGLGYEDKKLLKANLISVSKKIKGFSTISYNNIGENYSPYDFISNNLELSKANETTLRTSNLLNTNGFNSNLPNNRVSVNDNIFGSINALYKINQKTSLRVNYNLFTDKLIRKEASNILYDFDDNAFSIQTETNLIKSPKINTFEYELIHNINKKSILTSVGKIDFQNLKKSTAGMNNESSYIDLVRSEDLFIKNDLEYTLKLNDKNVFQLLGSLSSNNIPQTLNILSENNRHDQKLDFKKNNFKLRASVLSKSKGNEYSFDLGYKFVENFMDSDLQGFTYDNAFFKNDIYYKSAAIYSNFRHQFNIDKWRFNSKLDFNIYSILLSDSNLSTTYDNSIITLTPSLSVNYFLNKVSSFYADYSLLNDLPNVTNVYSGLILTDNRTLLNNGFEFYLFKNHNSSLGYRINDFYNLFQFNIYARYNFRKYGYINQINVDEDNSFYKAIIAATNHKDFNFGLDFEKYIHPLKSTFNINSTYSVNEYQNIVNDSELRNNLSKSWFGNFSMRTGFQRKINFENKLSFSNIVFKNEENKANSFTSFRNDFKIKYFPNDFQLILNNQYFKPDLSAGVSDYFFLDATVNYKPKNGKLEYQIKADNLFNNKIYRNIYSSDFSTSVFEHNLQERFVLLSILFKY